MNKQDVIGRKLNFFVVYNLVADLVFVNYIFVHFVMHWAFEKSKGTISCISFPQWE